jgi:DNA-binding transcriptional LysR family regulator
MTMKRLIDFGIAYGPVTSAEVEIVDLGLTQIACILRRDHRLAGKTLVTPADLVDESIVTYRSDAPLGREMEKVLREAGVDLDVMVRATALTAAQLAERGFGVALVDPLALNGGLFQNLTVRPFEPTTTARVQLVMPKGDTLSRAAQHLIQLIGGFAARQNAFAHPESNSGVEPS